MRYRWKWSALLLILSLLASLLGACAGTPSASPTPARDELVLIETEPSAPAVPEESAAPVPQTAEGQDAARPEEDGSYTTKEDVAAYLIAYGHLPSNFITKDEARAAGWQGGALEPYCPGKCIGGDRFGNREGLLPSAKGRVWRECDINTLGARSRGAERLVFSNDGLIYYTGDHYESFQLLYGEP